MGQPIQGSHADKRYGVQDSAELRSGMVVVHLDWFHLIRELLRTSGFRKGGAGVVGK
jgi:hypothetical protein